MIWEDRKLEHELKSDNLQYDTLGRWVVCLIFQASNGPKHVFSTINIFAVMLLAWTSGTQNSLFLCL